MIHIYIFVALMVIVFGLLVAYFAVDLQQSIHSDTVINFPIILGINSSLISPTENINIQYTDLLSFDETHSHIRIIDPNGQIITPKQDALITHSYIFPKDFVTNNMPLGKYSILIYDENQTVPMTKLDFTINDELLLTALADFSLNKGLPFTIAFAILFVTTIYQQFQNHQNNSKELVRNKAEWMKNNAKYYFDMVNTSWQICETISKNKNGRFQCESETKLLMNMIAFYRSNKTFISNVNMWYFDDVESEVYLGKIKTKIMEIYDEIFKNEDELAKFLSLERHECSDNKEFSRCKMILKTWIDGKELRHIDQNKPDIQYLNIEYIYLFHFIFSYVLYISINNGLIITYSSRNRIKQGVLNAIKGDLPIIERYLRDLSIIYGSTWYLRLKIDNKRIKTVRESGIGSRVQFFWGERIQNKKT